MMTFKGIQFSPDFNERIDASLRKSQNALDRKCIDLMENYTPIAQDKYPHHGKMSKSHKQERPGVIVNTEPKARREYYTNKGASGPNRGKLWFERMKLNHRPELLKAAKDGGK